MGYLGPGRNDVFDKTNSSLIQLVGVDMRFFPSSSTWQSLGGNGLLLKRFSISPFLINGEMKFSPSFLRDGISFVIKAQVEAIVIGPTIQKPVVVNEWHGRISVEINESRSRCGTQDVEYMRSTCSSTAH